MDIVGVVGAGQIGAGIAQVVATSGRRVILLDREQAIAEGAKAASANVFPSSSRRAN